MAQTFKEKLAELEAKRRFEQEETLKIDSVTSDTSGFSEESLIQNDVEAAVSTRTTPKIKIEKLTLAIFVSLFVIVTAQIYALGDFSLMRQVSEKSLDQKFTYQSIGPSILIGLILLSFLTNFSFFQLIVEPVVRFLSAIVEGTSFFR